ncbi:hypothetical protein [Silvimonas amylolytica]|uniref:hypothetical protein n=1 Tax=Silvimonas amylolytica TaxID=449663 RepID=UPI00166D8DF0|nr:hypothetical protein [Silvimonas amylolytica]
MLAVTTAAFGSVIALQLPDVISGNFESATNNTVAVKAMHLALMTMLMSAIAWITTLFLTCIPFVLGVVVAVRLQLQSWLYWVSGAILTMLALIPVLMRVPDTATEDAGPLMSTSERFMGALPLALIVGFAGLVYYLYLARCRQRRLDQDIS